MRLPQCVLCIALRLGYERGRIRDQLFKRLALRVVERAYFDVAHVLAGAFEQVLGIGKFGAPIEIEVDTIALRADGAELRLHSATVTVANGAPARIHLLIR